MKKFIKKISNWLSEIFKESHERKLHNEYLANYCLSTHKEALKERLLKTASLYNIDFAVNFNDCDSKQSLMKKWKDYDNNLSSLINQSLPRQ